MAREQQRDRKKPMGSKDKDKRLNKKKSAPLPKDIDWIDYKDLTLLRRFMSERGKIRARRVSGLTCQQQREVARAIKTARELALLPYATRVVSEGKGGRGRGRDRGDRPDRPDRGDRPERSDRNAEAAPAQAVAAVDTANPDVVEAIETKGGED